MSVLWSTVELIFWNNIPIHTIPMDKEISSFSCDLCRYLGFFFPASIFHFYLYFLHLKRFFLEAAARMPKKWKDTKGKEKRLLKFGTLVKFENHIPGLSPWNFLFKLLEISSEISWQCKAGIIESTYKWTNQIIYSNQISLYVNNSFKKVVQYFYYLVHGKLFNCILKPSIM